MNYKKYQFKVVPTQPGTDILIAHLSALGFDTFESNSEGFDAFVSEDMEMEFNAEEYQFDDFKYNFSIEKIQQTNWNEEWEKNFEPVLVDDLLCIRAPFHPSQKNVKHEIVIMPKMSFGTGHHQTTRMMCKAMFKMNFSNSRVMDMGCGTGILAILASKLGAKEVVGIDIDEWSTENSRENCLSNACPSIQIIKGDVSQLSHLKPFDHFLANINKNILKRDIPLYSKHLNPGAFLYLSGFFDTDREELLEVCKKEGFHPIDALQDENWAMLLLKKN